MYINPKKAYLLKLMNEAKIVKGFKNSAGIQSFNLKSTAGSFIAKGSLEELVALANENNISLENFNQ